MTAIEKIKVTTGIYWVGFPRAGLYVLCGCPEDSVKHLLKTGLIKTIEKGGVSFETGPNAILLSDVLIQQGHFSNLSEFLVLQMLYRQGMILPNHPNNTGEKPILIGTEKQVNAQMQYIYRGNYGLVSEDEIMQAGANKETAREMMRLKLTFAFGKIHKTEELLDSKIVEQDLVEIRNGVFIRRIGFNQFEFQYDGESTEVDLNLSVEEEYGPPYELGFYNIKREYFSIIHSGEGDGWDFNRPCMSSILVFQGKIYLIDSGPNILASLTSLGISINEIEGIFHTHAHDDHFVGLTTLMRADHRIKYFSTSLVRASVSKKLSALLSWNKDHLSRYFEIHDLEFDTWSYIEGLEVKPTFSPHPLETSIFTFRILWEGGYRTYAHFADLVSLDKLEGMITEDSSQPGISREFYDCIRSNYLSSVNLKKIDAGGGMIHGRAEDFVNDTSEKIVLSHKSSKLTLKEKEISSSASFGMVDVLIPASQDYTMRIAARLLHDYFPKVPSEDLQMLLNCNVVSFNAGSILLKEGDETPCIYLILTGIVELIHSKSGRQRIISTGSLVGESSGLMKFSAMETYRAVSYARALKIPSALYHKFVKKNKLFHSIEQIMDNREFLQNTWLFGEMVSYSILNKIAGKMNSKTYAEGEQFQFGKKQGLLLLQEGELRICAENKTIEVLHPGDFIGEETILYNTPGIFETRAIKKSKVCQICGDILKGIPVVQWKLLETYEKRLKISGVS